MSLTTWIIFLLIWVTNPAGAQDNPESSVQFYAARGRGQCNGNATKVGSGSILMAAADCRALQGTYQGDPQDSEVISCFFDWCIIPSLPTNLYGLGPARQGRCSPKPSHRGALRAYKRNCDNLGGYPQEGADVGDWKWVTCWLDWCEINNANRDVLVASSSDQCNDLGGEVASAVIYLKGGQCRRMGGKVLGNAEDQMWAGCVFSWCRAGKDCKKTQQGREYNGTLATTISGQPCQRWESRIPHDHGFNDPESYPERSVTGAANYCRNPEGWVEGPFCLTTNPQVPWELCDLPFCPGFVEKAPSFQLDTVKYHFIAGVHTDPEGYCSHEFRGHIATFDTLTEVRKVSRKLRWMASMGHIPEPDYIWVGGKTSLLQNTKITDLGDIEYSETYSDASRCIVLHRLREYELFSRSCPNLYFPFLCEVFSIHIANYSVWGGERRQNILDLTSCIRTCVPPCIAVDYNSVDRTCHLHDHRTGCSPGRYMPHVTHVALAECDCNTFLISGPAGVEDHALTASSIAISHVPYGEDVIAHEHSASKARLSANQGDQDFHDDMDEVGWVAAINDTQPWLQIEFEHLREIYGILTQGATGFNETRQPYWVSKFKVNISEDCDIWWTLQEPKTKEDKIFSGNVDAESTVMSLLDRAYHAKCVRIIAMEWQTRAAMQLEIIGCVGNQKNWALGRPAFQSSTCCVGSEAVKAVDGFAITNHSAPWSSCAHTRFDKRDPWWLVDLQVNVKVTHVLLTNRGDCCGSLLHDILVRVGQTFTGTLSVDLRAYSLCGLLKHVPQGGTEVLACTKPPTGRFVHIQILGPRETLILCEVKVHGEEVENGTDIARGKISFQSSNNHKANAAHAISTQAFATPEDVSTCSQTHAQSDPWWLVDLAEEFVISHVIVTNRGDCCAGLLHDFIVGVGNQFKVGSDNSLFEVCARVRGPMRLAETRRIDCVHAVSGRYVKIFLPGHQETLTLCKVQVFGNKVQMTTYGGNDSPRLCHFPFYYQDTFHHACIPANNTNRCKESNHHTCTPTNTSASWCATTEDFDRDKLWGYCMDVRLKDGRSSSEGRVEVRVGGVWGTVCDDGWNNTDAAVVCRQLGYQDGHAVFPPVFLRERMSPIHYRHVTCNGSESSLAECNYRTDAGRFCVHAEDAGVSCYEDAPLYSMVGYPAIYRSEHDHWRGSIILLRGSGSIYTSGKLTSWYLYSSTSGLSVTLQAWRPTNDPDKFVLLGQSEIITPHEKGEMHVELGEPIKVSPGDVLGIAYPRENPVPYDDSYNCDEHRISWTGFTRNLKTGNRVTFTGQGEKQLCRVYSVYATISNEEPLAMHDLTYGESVYRLMDELNATDYDLAEGLCHVSLGQNATLAVLSSMDEVLALSRHLVARRVLGEVWIGGSTSALPIHPGLVTWGHCQPEPGKECLSLKRNYIEENFKWFSRECTSTLTYVLCERNASGIPAPTYNPVTKMQKWGFIDSEEDEDNYDNISPTDKFDRNFYLGPYIGIIILVLVIIIIIIAVLITYRCRRKRGGINMYPTFKYKRGAPVAASNPDTSEGLENPMYEISEDQSGQEGNPQPNNVQSPVNGQQPNHTPSQDSNNKSNQ